jgi:hypothetical protein
MKIPREDCKVFNIRLNQSLFNSADAFYAPVIRSVWMHGGVTRYS